jgi:LPS sulfotransferase NodH
MDATFIQARIATIESQITAAEAVLTKLLANPNRSYTLNTGQTTESVTKYDIERIQAMIETMVGQLQFWEDCLNGTSGCIGRPGF